jgi:hypothetical protein
VPEKDTIQGLWIGGALSTMERLSIASFLAQGHNYHLYAYEDLGDVPAGTVIQDANEILPVSAIFQYREQESFSGFANYFRYKLLKERGGWWCDLDVVALRPFDFRMEYVFGQEIAGNSQAVVNSGVIKAPAGACIMNFAWERCLGRNPSTLRWGETGPKLMHEAVEQFELRHNVLPAVTFYPISYSRWYEVLLPGMWEGFAEQTHAVHLWHEMWRRTGVDKDEVFAPNCLYERLKARFLS